MGDHDRSGCEPLRAGESVFGELQDALDRIWRAPARARNKVLFTLLRVRLLSFTMIMGIAGSLWAFVYLGAWEPLAFNIDRSFQILFMVIIGGLGSILGSFLGAAFILVLPILLDQVPHALGIPISVETVSLLVFVVTGALICWLLIVEPHGFARLWSTAKEKLRLWPYPY